MKNIKIYCILFVSLFFVSCEKYLTADLDRQLTLEETFKTRASVERYMSHVYSFLPRDYHATQTWGWGWGSGHIITSAVARSDESYFSWTGGDFRTHNSGAWNPTTNDFHTWSHYYRGINQATVFLNNVGTCKELLDSETEIFTAEVRFLRAFFYIQLIQQYGPVYLWKDSDPDVKLEGPNVDRHSLDQNVEYVIAELDAAEALLRKHNVYVIDENKWFGRVTVGAVLAAKSRFMLHMARPLFNGHQWYVGIVNHYGDYLFPQTPDPTKWDKAASAARELLDLVEMRGIYELARNLTEQDPFTRAIRSYQEIYFDKWNKELIWAFWQNSGFDWLVRAQPSGGALTEGFAGYSPSLKLVDTYPMRVSGRFPIDGYRSDGDPIIDSRSGYVEEGFTDNWTHPADGTRMHADFPVHNSCVGRDARFYASIFFSGMHWYNAFQTWDAPRYVTFHSNGTSPYANPRTTDFVKNGYLFRRMNNPTINTNAGSWGNFSWPFFRLAEIYQKQNNVDLSIEYLSKIISIDPLNARAYSLRAENFAYQEKYQQAIEDFDTAIRLEPDNDNFYFARGGVYGFLLGNLELALQDFNKGIEINPKNSMLYDMRAVLYRKFLNDDEKAIADFKKAADLGSNEAKSVLRDYYGIDY